MYLNRLIFADVFKKKTTFSNNMYIINIGFQKIDLLKVFSMDYLSI